MIFPVCLVRFLQRLNDPLFEKLLRLTTLASVVVFFLRFGARVSSLEAAGQSESRIREELVVIMRTLVSPAAQTEQQLCECLTN